MTTRTPWKLAIAASVAASMLLTACGSDPSDDTSGGTGGGPAVDLAAAQESIEPLTRPPAEEDFPFTEPLSERPAPGTVVAFLDVGTPVAAREYADMSEAAKVLGIELQRVQTGQSPQEINAALNSVVESKPAAVIDVAIDPALFANQVEELEELGIPFIMESIVNADEFGGDDEQVAYGTAGAKANGKMLGSALLAETNGEATDLAFYNVPELAFSAIVQEGVKEQVEEQCPDCELRVVDVSITEVGSTAARTVVSDLQAHPDTEAFFAAIDELQIGLPAAMDVAGIDVPGMGVGGTPLNLQQVADGQELGLLTVDYSMLAWATMDRVARELADQEYDQSFWSEATAVTSQVITKDNVPSDFEAGYVAFPDYKERFTQLWGGQ
ncbi:sugar ABC transporter substrate-binding protein [Geodermatophilus sp. URMC 62]|uniref:sugar ABC transporter substrate-binding protein n=1 Tax=Geodermatophilus sp. URMC 62 TaxID=3423414 RepID=UPI00406C22BC